VDVSDERDGHVDLGELITRLIQKNALKRCPACGQTNKGWAIIVEDSLRVANDQMLGLICQNCGLFTQHSMKQLNKPDETAPANAETGKG
jgi:transcription elongation factor Elf1